MVLNKKTKQQLSVLIAVAVILILLIIVGIIFAPSSSGGNKNIPVDNTSQSNDAVQEPKLNSYNVSIKMLDSEYNALTNTRFIISLNDTLVTTDANGYIVLNNLPEGIYYLYAVDKNGNKNSSVYCEFQLSSDGAVSVGYVFFEKDDVVYIMFDGTRFVAIEKNQIPVNSTTPDTQGGNTEEYVIEDQTYTNFSWMKNIEQEYGAYGVSLYLNPNLFYEILNNPEFSYFNTFLLQGNNMELTLKEAEILAKHKKKMWLSVNDLITFKSFGGSVVSGNLQANWQDTLNEWASKIYQVAGDYFQGFYFDEPSYYYNSKDFTRITKYMRQTFKLRTFAVHCSVAYMTPHNRNKNIIGYVPAPNDPMVITPENHKYVTDVGWWRYGSVRSYGDIDVSFNEWSKAMSMLDKNTRKWYVPSIGAYYWDTLETDTLDVQYTMFKNNAKLEGFGGIMHYTLSWSSLSGRPTPVNPEDERLKENEIIYDKDGNKVGVQLDHNYSSVNLPDAYMEGNGAYFIIDRQEDGTLRWPSVRKYMDILGNGISKNETYEEILSKLEAVYKPDFSKYK